MMKFEDIITDHNLRLTPEYITVDNSIRVIKFKGIEFSKVIFKDVDILYNSNDINYSRLDSANSNSMYDLYFENCVFKESLEFSKLINKTIRFDDCQFHDIILKDLYKNPANDNILNGVIFKNIKIVNNITIDGCEFHGKFYINKQYDDYSGKVKINKLVIKNTEFKDNFKLHHCEIKEIDIQDTDFEKNADFYLSHFRSGIKQNSNPSEIYFKALNFRGLALFGETIFDKKFNLLYVTIEGHSHFRKAEFKEGLDLDYVNIQNEMNFFGVKGLDFNISKDNTSQETYRIIKHNFEKLGNKIEANKYHSLELDQKRKVLNSQNGDWKDRWIFNLHNLSSEHSTNWLRSLMWIFFVGIMTTFFSNSFLYAIVPVVLYYVVSKYCNNNLSFLLVTQNIILFILITIISSLCIDDIFKYINVITKADEFENSFLMTVNKVSLGYLYYQFLMSVRKDTRK